MNAVANYLLGMNLAIALFYALYYILLRRETNFRFLRSYLLLALCGSALLPMVPWKMPMPEVSLVPVEQVLPSFLLPALAVGNAATEESSPDIGFYIVVIYGVGVAFMIIRLIISLHHLLRAFRTPMAVINDGPCTIIHTRGTLTFSFFRYVVIGHADQLSDDERAAIVRHEKAHVALRHSFDNLLATVALLVCWFNPVIYFYKKTLILVHEYEADSRAVAGQHQDLYCSLLAKAALHSAGFSIANHFTSSLTLKRIDMIKQAKYGMAAWKKISFVPLVMLVVLVLACEEQVLHDLQQVSNQSTVVTEYPAEVQKSIAELKAINPNAEVQVLGVMDDDKAALEGLHRALKANEIKSVHIVKPTTKQDFDNYVVIEKGSSLNAVSSASADGDVFTVVEETAQPVGGMEALYVHLHKTISLPPAAKEAKTSGRVFVQFVVNEDGSLSDFTVLKGIGNGCDEEVVRAMKLSPPWVPGKQGGKIVKQRMVLPIGLGH